MKNSIIKFLGLDKIQEELQSVQRENANLRSLLQNANDKYNSLYSDFHNVDWDEIARDNISISDIADNIDLYDLVDYIETSDIASHIDTEDVARSIDYDELSDNISIERVMEYADINIDTLAEQVAERIADRDGMQQLVSEEVENHASTISTDAVESMIHSAIQQFADSLEVMVSAKLNYEK